MKKRQKKERKFHSIFGFYEKPRWQFNGEGFLFSKKERKNTQIHKVRLELNEHVVCECECVSRTTSNPIYPSVWKMFGNKDLITV